MKARSNCSSLLPLAGGLLLLAAFSVSAANDTWTGGGSPDGSWQNANNWGGTAPLADDFLFFDTGNQNLATNNYAAGTVFGTLSFISSAGAFTLYGNSFILTNGANAGTGGNAGAGTVTGGSITNSSSNPETIVLPVTLSAGKHVMETDGGATLNLNGTVSRNLGATVSFAPNNGSINVTGGFTTNGLNNILGGWATLGNDWATLDANSNVVAFPSVGNYVTIAGGAMSNNASFNMLYNGSGTALTSANGTQINSLNVQESGATTLTLTGVLRVGAEGGIMRNGAASGAFTVTGGNITTAGSGGEITLGDEPFNATGNNLTVNSAITNDTGNAAVSVIIMGYVAIGGASTYSGGTYINQGRVQQGATGAFGTGPVYVFPGGHVFMNTGTITNDFYIAGVGSTEASGNATGPGAIRNNGETSSGRIILMSNARYGTSSANSVQKGQITGTGQIEFSAFTGNQNVMLSNTNTVNTNNWVGGALVNALGSGRQIYLKCGASNQIGGNSMVITGLDIARFDLNGNSDVIGGLTSASNPNYQIANFATNSSNSTLTLGFGNATATFGGTISDGGTGTNLSIVKIGTGTQTFTGANTANGKITVNGGSLIFGVGAFSAGTTAVTVNNNAILDISAVSPVTLGVSGSLTMSNGTIVVAPQGGGNAVTTPVLTANGTTNLVSVISIPSISGYPAQFTLIKGATVNGTLNFGLAGSMPASPSTPYAGFISNNIANNSVDLVVTAGPTSIAWQGYGGGAPNSAWDTTTFNWIAAGVPTLYMDGNFVRFDDSSSNNVVTLAQDVSPAGITVSNNALAYTINGGNNITGVGGLSKQGTGTLILDNGNGNNNFGGGVFISGGTLQIGNNDGIGNLPATGSVVNSGTLVFDYCTVPMIANVISGSGSLVQQGGDTVQLSGANSFTGSIQVVSNAVRSLGSTLQVGGSSGLGIGTVVSVSNNCTLDLNGFSVLNNSRVVARGAGTTGQGAIDNSSATIPPADVGLTNLTLTGNTTLGTSGNRWDLRSPGGTTGSPTTAGLSTGGQPYSITKVGTGGTAFIGLVSATVDTNLANIDVQQGQFQMEGNTTSLGNPTNTLTVENSATFSMYSATNRLNKVIVLNDGGILFSSQGTNIIIGPVVVTNTGISGTPNCYVNVGNGASYSMTMSGPLSGNGILYKYTGTNQLTLSGNSPSFAGGLTINSGPVLLTGTLNNSLGVVLTGGSTSALILNGTLLGAGITNSSVTTVSGTGSSAGLADLSGNVFPGAAGVMGTLTFGGMILDGGTFNFDLGATNTVGSGSNDLIQVNGDLVVNGGTVNINPTGLLQTGPQSEYCLFKYTGNLIWEGDPSLNIGVNNYNFAFDTNTPGQVNIVITGGPAVWNGGSVADNFWSDSANWSGVSISSGSLLYFGGTARLNNTNDTSSSATYGNFNFIPGAGAFVLNGNPVTLGGSNIINNSSSPQTIDIGLNFSTAQTFSGASANLIIGGGVTNTANVFNTLTLAGTGILTNILNSTDPNGTNTILLTASNANWTLTDNSSSTPMSVPWPLNINNGTFNFGNAGSAPNLTTTSVNGAPQDNVVGAVANAFATFNMSNGTFTTMARLNTGTASGATGVVSQVGGTLTIGSQFQGANGATNAFSFVNISGGTMNIGTVAAPTATFYDASRGPGTLTVSGTGALNCGTLDVSRAINSGIPGTVNLNGGIISASRVGTATANSTAGSTGDTATFNFNGGTLRAATNSTTFYQGSTVAPVVPITSIVKIGGAIIDDGGFAITMLEPLQHDATLGSAADGGLVKNGAGTLTLTAASTYTGGTLVNNGTLAVNGSLGLTSVTVATNGTLVGTGSLGSNVTVNVGGTLSPGAVGALGTLTVVSNVTLNGTAAMDINAGTLTNDVLKAGSITYGGTLSVTNLAGTPAGGNSFKLFTAASLTGTFAATNLPSLGSGMGWSWNPATGILSVTQTVNTNPATANFQAVAASGSLQFSWAPDHLGWQLYTNATGLTAAGSWFPVPGSAAVTNETVTINPSNPNVFFQLRYP